MLKIRQIGYSDLVILNKVDLVTPTYIEVAKEWVNAHLNRIRIVEAVQCDVPLEILLSVGRFDPTKMDQQNNEVLIKPLDSIEVHNSASNLFKTWSYQTHQPLSLTRLREMVRKELPAFIYRCKGILFCAEFPGKRFALQIVGRRTEIRELDAWDGKEPISKIVAIGSSDEINADILNALFESCIVQPETSFA